MSSALVAHCGAVHRTRAELADIPTPARTRSWTPIAHSALVDAVVADLHGRGLEVVREQYATQGRDDAKIFGVMDVAHASPGVGTALLNGDIGMAIGLRASNDKSMRVQLIAAARVFVCDNMAFSGGEGAVVLKKKHTGRLDLSAIIPAAIDSFLSKADAFRVDIDRMKNHSISDTRAKEIIYDGFVGERPLLPVRLFPEVHRLYFEDEAQRAKFPERTLWTALQSFTEAVKVLPPAVQQRDGLAIGRFFADVIKGTDGSQLAGTGAVEMPADTFQWVAPDAIS